MQSCFFETGPRATSLDGAATTILALIPALMNHLDEVLARLAAGERGSICGRRRLVDLGL